MLARASLQRKNKYNIADSLRSIIVYSEFWSDTAGVRTLEHTKHTTLLLPMICVLPT